MYPNDRLHLPASLPVYIASFRRANALLMCLVLFGASSDNEWPMANVVVRHEDAA